MILRPQLQDLRIIGHFLGKMVLGFGLMMALPLIVAVLFKEEAPLLDFSIGLFLSIVFGSILIEISDLPKGAEMRWMHGMVIVSIAWLVCMFLGALPLYLSGHWKSFLDACFDAMSGLATTGLILVQDLDHLSHAANFWRHLMMFIGGQGIIVVALSFLVRGTPGAFRLYMSEAREEKILPNIVETAKFIWLVSLVYLVLGTGLLSLAGMKAGLPAAEAAFDGICIFMAAFDTGGFAPHSQNIVFYQSSLYEGVTILIMLWGAINFNLHYAVWTGRRRELFKDIEIRTFFVTFSITLFIVLLGLARGGAYAGPFSMLRRGFYQVISGHSGTGFQTIAATQFVTDWGPLALLGLMMAMAFGGSVCSTTGGIKVFRIGLIFQSLRQDIKRFLSSESSVTKAKYRHLRDLVLDDRQVRSIMLITLAYVGLYLLGALVGCFYGHPFLYSLFESTSAAANVGLSCGITQASMPAAMKVTYILQMWIGRLEFMSVLVFGGFVVSYLRGR